LHPESRKYHIFGAKSCYAGLMTPNLHGDILTWQLGGHFCFANTWVDTTTGIVIGILNIRRKFPKVVLGIIVPGLQRLLFIWVLVPKFF
jgi:hypothetical protein